MHIVPKAGRTGVVVVSTAGGIDEAHAFEFTATMFEHIDRGATHIVVSCADSDYLTSLQLGVLAQLSARVRLKHGAVHLCHVKKMILDALAVTRMESMFEIHPDLASALAAVPG